MRGFLTMECIAVFGAAAAFADGVRSRWEGNSGAAAEKQGVAGAPATAAASFATAAATHSVAPGASVSRRSLDLSIAAALLKCLRLIASVFRCCCC